MMEGKLPFFQEKGDIFLKSRYRTGVWGGAAILLVMR